MADMPKKIWAGNNRVWWENEPNAGCTIASYDRYDVADDLKDALRDVLKAICTDRHAVQDTLWVNGTPVGDFIMCALDEDIDLDELQNAPYRCKKTGEMFKDELLEALLTALPYVEDVLGNPEQLKCFKAGAVQRDVKKIREAIKKAGG